MSVIRITKLIELELHFGVQQEGIPELPKEIGIIDCSSYDEDVSIGVGRNFRIVDWDEEYSIGTVQAELTIPSEYKNCEFLIFQDRDGFEIVTDDEPDN